MELRYDIEPENLNKLEIKKITQDKDKFGVLTFDKAFPLLEELRSMLVEIGELGYESKLTQGEIDSINNYKKRFLQYVKQIYQLNPIEGSFNSFFHDQLEDEIQDFYNSVARALREPLIYLRQEAAKTSSDSQALAEQQKAAAQAEAEYKKLATDMRRELEELSNRKNEISSSQGEVAAIGLGKFFEAQANEYNTQAAEWKDKRDDLFWWLMVIIGTNLVLYIALFVTNKVSLWPHIAPEEFFTLQYGLVKLALIGLLSYAIGFATRNFNINAGLVSTNRHRKNVAETLANTLASPLEEDAKATLAREAAVAMFQNLSVGYIKKEHQSDSGPISEIVKKILPN